MTPAEAIARVPVLRADYLAGAYIEPHSMDIDVNGLHQGICAVPARAAPASSPMPASRGIPARRPMACRDAGGNVPCTTLVNAAGAWAMRSL